MSVANLISRIDKIDADIVRLIAERIRVAADRNS